VIKHLPDGRHFLKMQTETLQIQNGRMLYEYETKNTACFINYYINMEIKL